MSVICCLELPDYGLGVFSDLLISYGKEQSWCGLQFISFISFSWFAKSAQSKLIEILDGFTHCALIWIVWFWFSILSIRLRDMHYTMDLNCGKNDSWERHLGTFADSACQNSSTLQLCYCYLIYLYYILIMTVLRFRIVSLELLA